PSTDISAPPSDPSLAQLDSEFPGVTIGRVIQLERELAAASAASPALPPPPLASSASSKPPSQPSSALTVSSEPAAEPSLSSPGTAEDGTLQQHDGSNTSSSSSQSPGSSSDLSIRVDWGRQVSKEQRLSEIQRARQEGRCSNKGGLFNAWPWEGGFSEGFLAWEPQPDKYILMDCQRNQVSNRIRCIRNYLIVAGVLNRTLVAPFRPSEVNGSYDRHVFFDLTHMRRCYGPRTVITLDELLAERRAARNGNGSSGNGSSGNGSSNNNSSSSSTAADIIITQVVCPFTNCYFQPGWGLPTVLPTLGGVSYEALTFTDANLPPDHSINITDIKRIGDLIFPSADVFVMGDLGASLFDETFHRQIDVPFFRRPGCPNKLAIQPHPAIFEAASRFVTDVLVKGMNGSAAESSREGEEQGNNTAAEDTLPSAIAAASGGTTTTSTSGSSGKNASQLRYMAIHWRRKDLVTSFQDSGSHLTINRTARCIADRMAKSGNLSTVFLATDAEPAEVAELTGAVLSHRPDLRLMQLPPNLDAQAWAQVLLPHRFEHPGVVRVTLDKAVCALADVFLGTAASSFTEDIQRIRTGLRVAHCEDQMLCEDEL
ncbi:unnamed protein product, partial [Closterium sp. Naga37s-1]